MPDSEVFTISNTETPLVSSEKTVETMVGKEPVLLYSGKSVDIKAYQADRNLGVLVGQGFADSLLSQLTDTPATFTTLIGKAIDMPEQPKRTIGFLSADTIFPFEDSPNPPSEVSLETQIGEKMRNFNLALRQKLAMQQEKIAPQGFGEKVAFGVGQAGGSLLGMIGMAALGGMVGAELGGGLPGAAVGSAAGAGASIFLNEKASMAKELMDAGFKPSFVDQWSTLYAIPMTATILPGFGFLAKISRPMAVQAVRTAVGRSFLRASITKGGQIALKAVEGGAVMGGINVASQEIKAGFDQMLGLKDYNLQQEMADGVVNFVVGGFVGGMAGAAGQLRARRQTLTKLEEMFPEIPRSEIAAAHDDAVLRTNQMVLDGLIEQTDVSPQMRSIEKTFAKIMKRNVQVQGEPITEPLNAQGFAATANLIDAEGILVDAKTKGLQKTITDLSTERLKINRQILQSTGEKAAEKIAKLQVRVDQVNVELTNAQEQYATALKGNPKLQALEQKLGGARAELMAKDPAERARAEQAINSYERSETALDLYAAIRKEGGIAPYTGKQAGKLQEEYKNLPKRVKNKSGKSLDTMAASLAGSHPQLGITDETSLLKAISDEQTRLMNQNTGPANVGGGGKVIGFDRTEGDIESSIKRHIISWDIKGLEVIDVKIHPKSSRKTGLGIRNEIINTDEFRDISDLDVVVEYKGKVSESDAYDLLAAGELKLDGIPIDLIPQLSTSGERKAGASEEVAKLKDTIASLETKIQGIAGPEETVKVAEQKVDKIQTTLVDTFQQLLELSTIHDALRLNPEWAFEQEMGRMAKDRAELDTWRAQQEASLTEEKSQLQRQAETLTEEITAAEQQAEAFRQGAAKVAGKVSLNASQIRQMAHQDLRNVLEAFKAGVKISEQTFKAMQKAFLALLPDLKFSNKAKTLLLRKVLTVRTAEQFNARIGLISDSINTILRGDTVAALQQLGQKVIDNMMPGEGKVSPQTQLFAEHLRRVLRGQVPRLEYNESNPVELAKSIVEGAAYDLHNAEADTGVAIRAFQTLKDFYQDGLQRYSDQKATQQALAKQLQDKAIKAIGNGIPLNINKEAADSVRLDMIRKAKARFSFTPYDVSFLTILNLLDGKSGKPSMQGPLVRAFTSEKPYQAWMVWTGESRNRIDGEFSRIYGKDSDQAMANAMGNDFLDVVFTKESPTGENVQTKENIPKSVAMSLWLMTKMNTTRADLIQGMGIDEQWLQSFEHGENVNFTPRDYQWMQSVRETLDWYASSIAPVYERLTGKPFRMVQEYFMLQRYMTHTLDEGGLANKTSALETMLGEGFERASVADSAHFKARSKSEMAFRLPDINQALSRYALDMNHFLAYADYVKHLQETFQSDAVRNLMKARLPQGIPPVINKYIENLVNGGSMRSVEREAMSKFFRNFSWYARNQISSLKNLPRQFSAIAAFTQYEGIGAYELVLAAADLPRAAKSGELKGFTDTWYMKLRHEGMYDFAVSYAQDIAHAEQFSSFRENAILRQVRRGVVSKTFNDLMTGSARVGDRWASVVGGWAMYQKVLKETGNTSVAIDAAIRSVEETQQSMDPGRLPVVFQETGLPYRLLTVFQRTPMIFYDQYMRMQRAYWVDKRMTTSQYIRAMVTWHLWVPLFEATVTSIAQPFNDKNKWSTGIAMLTGPFGQHYLFGRMIAAMSYGVFNRVSGGEAQVPAYLQDVQSRTLIESFGSELVKAFNKSLDMFDRPDVDMMWDWVRAMGQAGDAASPVPSGWLSNAAYGVYQMFTGDGGEGLANAAGYPASQTK